jgi:hypothetical protein
MKELLNDVKFNMVKILHNLNEFSTDDLTDEQIKAINNNIINVKNKMKCDDIEWEKMRQRDKFYKSSCLICLNEFENLSPFQIQLLNLNVKEIDYIPELMSLAGEYCFVDSYSCHTLALKRNVIQDKREMSNMSYSTLFDAIFRADGFRIRNILICEGQREGISISNISKEKPDEVGKYPGAFVCPPKKGIVKPTPSLRDFFNFIKNS